MGKRGKQQKYAVFSISQLRNMITHARKGGRKTVVLRFETSGKKWPGQLSSKHTWYKGNGKN